MPVARRSKLYKLIERIFKYRSQEAWGKGCNDFVHKMCTDWGLPTFQDPAKLTPQGSQQDDRTKTTDEQFDEADIGVEIRWSGGQDRFVFVVDCQSLQQISCGHTPLANETYLPIFQRISENIAAVFNAGKIPPSANSDPVLWSKRENNRLADHLCNVTMDRKRSWREDRRVDIPEFCNFMVFSDGGSRKDCSASAWVIGFLSTADGHMRLTPCLSGGIYMETRVNSFLAEAIAFEHTTAELNELIHIQQQKFSKI